MGIAARRFARKHGRIGPGGRSSWAGYEWEALRKALHRYTVISESAIIGTRVALESYLEGTIVFYLPTLPYKSEEDS